MQKLIFLVLLFSEALFSQNPLERFYYEYPKMTIRDMELYKDGYRMILTGSDKYNGISTNDAVYLTTDKWGNVQDSIILGFSDAVLPIEKKDTMFFWGQMVIDTSKRAFVFRKSINNSVKVDTVFVTGLLNRTNRVLKNESYYSFITTLAATFKDVDSSRIIVRLPLDLDESKKILYYTVTTESRVVNDWAYLKQNKEYFVFGWNGPLFLLDSNYLLIKELKNFNYDIRSEGNILNEGTHLIVAGLAENTDFSATFGISKIGEDYKKIKSDVLYTPQSNDYPSLDNCLAKVNNHYFVAAMYKVSFLLRTDTSKVFYRIVKYDEDLNRKWVKFFGGDRRYVLHGITEGIEGGVCAYGFIRDVKSNYLSVPFYQCFDENGEIVSSKEEKLGNNPIKIVNNPVNESLEILMEEDESIFFEIFNTLGQKIQNGILTKGLNQINVSNYPKGIYILSTRNRNGELFLSQKWIKS